MEPKKVGRALGIGVRVASKMVQQRVSAASAPEATQNSPEIMLPVAAPAQAQTQPVSQSTPRTSPNARPKEQIVRNGNRLVTAKRGAKAFGQAFLGPFTHAGSILWLEITGLFFLLFTVFFVQSVYRTRASWHSGPDHLHLYLYVVLALGFAWFSFSSFLRAHRKSKRGPAGRTHR